MVVGKFAVPVREWLHSGQATAQLARSIDPGTMSDTMVVAVGESPELVVPDDMAQALAQCQLRAAGGIVD